MNSGNSKISGTHKLLLSHLDNIFLSNLSIYYAWKNIKKSNKSSKHKLSLPTLKEKFELPDGSYSISNIQDYFEDIIEKQTRFVFQGNFQHLKR